MTVLILPDVAASPRRFGAGIDTIPRVRVGHGYDAHRFTEGRKLVLGGIEVPHERGLAGHSDGDALLHAIIDALLGAAALGDIGAMFPSSDERWKDAASIDLLVRARTRVRESGYRIANVDATLTAEEPKIAPLVMEMRRRIAEALQIDITDVSIKGTTADGMGFTGRREGVAASAVVLIE